jgi:hypothetical protein
MKKEMQLKQVIDLVPVGEMLSTCGNIASNYAILKTVSSMHSVINEKSKKISNSPESKAVSELQGTSPGNDATDEQKAEFKKEKEAANAALGKLCSEFDESIVSFDVHQLSESKLPDSVGTETMGDMLMRIFPGLEKLKNKDVSDEEKGKLNGAISASRRHPVSTAMRIFGNVSLNAVFVRWADTIGLIKEE